MTSLEGHVAPGFEAVAEVFVATLDTRGGAAFAAVVDGELVVDLWGGVADAETGARWRSDTIVPIFSGSKPLVALCVLKLVERGQISLDDRVSRYWPEFAALGKNGVRISHVLSHTAGVPGLDRQFPVDELLDPTVMAAAVAAETPLWPPGSSLAYQAYTFGWICGELVQRVDGRRVGRFFADEFADPLQLELWMGLPARLEPRVARVAAAPTFGMSYFGAGLDKFSGSHPEPAATAYVASRWNDTRVHQAEVPGVNGIGNARSIARLDGALARGGEIDGIRILESATVDLTRRELSRGPCRKSGRPYAFAAGFELQTELARFGPPADAFGHTGSGGSTHGAWPAVRTGFSYVMNELRLEVGDRRSEVLLDALDRALRPRG